MKTLTASQEAARASGRFNALWFAQVDWAAPVGMKTYTLRSVDTGASGGQEQRLQSAPGLSRSTPVTIDMGGVGGSAQFTLENLPQDENRVEILFEQQIAHGLEVRIYFAFATAGLSEADWTLMGRYRIIDYEIGTNEVTVICEDWVTAVGGKKTGRKITDARFPDAPSASYGKTMPQIVGTVEDCPLIPVATGRSTNLDGEIGEDDEIIFVTKVQNADGTPVFPATGTILIEGEQIAYTKVGLVAGKHAFGSAASPCLRGQNGTDAVGHGNGAPVVLLRAEGYDFLVADHPCVGVSEVRIDGGQSLTEGTDYEVVEEEIEGRTVTIARMGTAPTRRRLSDLSAQAQFDASNTTWAVDGSVSNPALTPGNAIDGDEEANQTTAATIQTSAGQRNLSLNMSSDLSGRATQLESARLEVEYQVIPGADAELNGPGGATLIPWGAPRVEVRRGGSLVKAVDLKKPRNEEFQSLVDTIRGQALSPTQGTLDDSRPLFTPLEGAPTSGGITINAAISSVRADDVTGTPPSSGLRINHWDLLTANVVGELFNDFFSGNLTSQLHEYSLPPSASWAPVGSWMRMRAQSQSGLANSDIIQSMTLEFTCRAYPIAPNAFDRVNTNTMTARFIHTTKSRAGNAVLFGESNTAVAISINFAGLNLTWQELRDGTIEIEHGSGIGNYGIDPGFEVDYFKTGGVDFVGPARMQVFKVAAFVGSTTPLTGRLNDTLNQGALSAASRLTQKVSLTSLARALDAPWEWFDGTLNFRVSDGAGPNQTKILIYDVRIVASERSMVTETLDPGATALLATVQGYGRLEDSGTLADTTYHAARLLLGHADFMGMEEDVDWDDASLLAASKFGAQEAQPARRIDGEIELRALLAELCFGTRMRAVWEGGKFRFKRRATATASDSVRSLTADDILASGDPTKSQTQIYDIANEVALNYRKDYSAAEAPFTRTLGAEIAGSIAQAWGRRRETFFSDWIRRAEDAGDLLEWLGPAVAWKYTLADIVLSLSGIDLELGDVVIVTDARARLFATVGEIVGARVEDLSRVRLKVAIQDFRERTFLGPTTWYEVTAGNQQMVFVIENQVVAILDANGVWRIKGELNEVGYMGFEAGDTCAGEIEYDDVEREIRFGFRLQFGAGGETWYCKMKLDYQGNMTLEKLVERDLLPAEFAYPEEMEDYEGIDWTFDSPKGHMTWGNFQYNSGGTRKYGMALVLSLNKSTMTSYLRGDTIPFTGTEDAAAEKNVLRFEWGGSGDEDAEVGGVGLLCRRLEANADI